MRRAFLVLAGLLVLAYPVLTAPFPVYQRLGALVLLAAIGSLGLEHRRRLCRAGLGRASVFFGIGAYSAVLAYHYLRLPPIVGIPVGMAVSVAIAAVIGVPTLRLSGHYFSMATIAVAELAEGAWSSTSVAIGGAQGLSGPTSRAPCSISPSSRRCLTTTSSSASRWRCSSPGGSENSRMGFYLRAIKDSERAARSLGVAAGRYKLYAYMLSAALTALAGGLYLTMFGFVDPESGFGILISVKMLIMAALGGAGLLFGPLVGALILVPLEELSNSLLGGKGAGLTFVVYGAIIVIIARFLPSGMLVLFQRGPASRRDAGGGSRC